MADKFKDFEASVTGEQHQWDAAYFGFNKAPGGSLLLYWFGLLIATGR